MSSVASPDGAITADWYQVSGGGAASAVSDTVALRFTNEPFTPRRRDYVFGAMDADTLELHWRGDRQLEIIYPSRSYVGRMSPTWKDVKIAYIERRMDDVR